MSRANIVERLHDLIELRRRGVDGAVVSASRETTAGRGGAGAVMHILFHAAPHNETFTTAMRVHIGRPMVEGVRELIPRIDASYGIERTPEEVESLVRVFMSLFAGYFTTSLMFDHQPNDDAIVNALLAIMGWAPPTSGVNPAPHGRSILERLDLTHRGDRAQGVRPHLARLAHRSSSVLVLPLVQLLLFGYAISFDVRNVPTVVFDADHTVASRAYVDAADATRASSTSSAACGA